MPSTAEDLNTALRELIEVVRTADLEQAPDVAADAAGIRAITKRLRPHVVEGMRMQAALHYGDDFSSGLPARSEGRDVDEFAREGIHDPNEFFPYSPVVGPLNPIAPPVKMWRVHVDDSTEIHGQVEFGAAYNGPPDCAHGGVIAEVLDELLGCVCVVNGLGGFTGTLTVVYRSPSPLGRWLTLRGWHDRSEGRKIHAKGTIHDGDTLLVEAEGVFIRSAQLPGGGVSPERV